MTARTLITVAAAAVLLAGCSKKAEGQVAAVVNSEEITLAEVNAELAMQSLPKGVDESKARQAALKRIIERRLLAQVAKDEGLDKTPDFLIRQRALGDALLVQALAKKIESTVKVPDAREIDATIKDRPTVFANRSVLSLNQLQFARAAAPTVVKELEAAHSLEEIEAMLRARKIAYTSAKNQIDSASLPAPVAKQILALPPGEPFVLPQGDVYVVGVVTGSRPVPFDEEKAKPAVVALLRSEQIDKAVRQRLDAAKQAAKIEYQKGFAPTPDSGAAKAP